ncbi:hypothetical protein ACVBEQ_12680 [Nakamurella sp. GG22]
MTDTPDAAATTLVRHLSEVAGDRAVEWMIAGPGGRIHHGRFVPPVDQPASAAVADYVDAVHGRLLRDAAQLMTAGLIAR